jgi:branched-chain amino acid transport system substrate-binding protein
MSQSLFFSASAFAVALLGILSVESARAQDAAPFRLGYIVDASGPQQTTIKPAYDAFQLYIDRLNAAGGVHGRRVQIVARDSQSDVQRSLDAVQGFVDQKVLGILGLAASNAHAAVYAAAAKADTPVVAGYPVNLPLVLPPAKPGIYGIGLELSVAGQVGAQLAHRIAPEAKSTICVAFEVPGSMLACEKIVETAKANGFETTQILTVPLAQRDFRTVVERILRADPSIVTMCLGQAHVASLLPALATSGYDGIFLSMDTGIGHKTLLDAVPADSPLTVYSYGRYVAEGAEPGDGVAALSAALERAGRGAPTASAAGGWTLGLVVERALELCGPDCAEPAEFAAALDQVDLDTQGLTGTNLRLSPTDHFGPSAYRLYRLDGAARRFEPVGDWLQVGPGGAIQG